MRTLVALLAAMLMSVGQPSFLQTDIASSDPDLAERFETDLEQVRQALGIPGMAAAVVRNQELVWATGFGFADLDNEIEATPHTPFGLASVTKPMAATLIMQLVEDGVVELDALVSSYGVDLPDGDGVTVRHLLTHTSEGVLGTLHNYNGNRYGYLGGVIEGATGRTFSDLLGKQILVPLQMTDTALNPLNSWSETSLIGFEDFSRTLGWGYAFDHYPDVYDRLAQPYQFDDDYSIIPGMYHLLHNPAAGGISSVSDLAKFDIALDSGVLLGDTAATEMLSPAVATVAGRTDLSYGLGWYVQDYDGLRLVWHAGRWPPSTSALYLKVPDLGLTFVVLANTDNLTVPFPSIGNGDISRSLLALTFFHHFVLPQERGFELPEIDWFADEGVLASQLAGVEEDAARVALERELWSYRQAFAASGQFDRADALAAVARQAFAGSPMGFDGSFTWTAGRTPIETPLLSARSLGSVSRLILGWLIVVGVSLVWMLVRLFRTRARVDWESAVWLIAALLMGPLAVAARWIRRQGTSTMEPALCASIFSVAGYSVAWVIGLALLLRGGTEPNPLAIFGALVLIPLIIGLLAIRSPLLRTSGVATYGRAARQGILAEVITWGLGLAVFFPLTLYVDNRWLATIPYPTSPYFGAMISVMAVLGVVVLFPLNRILQRRGFTIWSGVFAERGAAEIRLPTLRDSWWLLLTTLAIMLAAIGFAGSVFGS